MPKSYSQYKYDDLKALGVELKLRNFIKTVTPIEASDFLITLLEMNTDMTLNTEKAKSEFIIAPILYEIARKNRASISFFSGHNLNVDKDLGLKGFCDFLFTKVPESTYIKEPIFCIVEAKNDNLENGVPQCVAEMYAARLFNERKNTPVELIYGCVTTGYLWQFLKLDGSDVYQDTTIYSLSDLSKVLGILQSMVEN
jgi:hypothetical protein